MQKLRKKQVNTKYISSIIVNYKYKQLSILKILVEIVTLVNDKLHRIQSDKCADSNSEVPGSSPSGGRFPGLM